MLASSDQIVGDLSKVRRDLEDATHALGRVWRADDHDEEIGHLTNAAEALLRAVSSLTLVTERLTDARFIPCTDLACDRPHETRRTGPTFASFHKVVGG